MIPRFTHNFMPGLEVVTRYKRSWLRCDLGAGLSVAAIALPVGIAYADLAGVPTVIGIYSAIFPLLAYALFGSSHQLMTGPDAATCIIVAAILGPLAGGDPERYLALMVTLTLITGVMFILAGWSRLGFISNFLSRPILTGYLNGVALLIIAGQFQKLFGYSGEAEEFFPKLVEFIDKLDQSHLPTLVLGLSLLAVLIALYRLAPKLPAALIAIVIGITAVTVLGLDQNGIAVLGNVPAGLPSLHIPVFEVRVFMALFDDAAAIALVSFTSGILTAKSFAQRNRYEIDANQELIAYGACNIASGLVQGFPVTGASSRTAVNDSVGGKTQLVGIIAAVSMLLILFFLTGPLAYVPTAALSAVIIVAAAGLFDFKELRALYGISHREFLLSIGTTLGVLILGVLPGVLLAVALSILWLLKVMSLPQEGMLGRVKGVDGYHDIKEFPEATTIPGLILYRFDANLVFFNADYFINRVRTAVASAKTPVEWFIIDVSSINLIDITALQKVDELREELLTQGIVLAEARAKPASLKKYFKTDWGEKYLERTEKYRFETTEAAIRAFNNRVKKDASLTPDS